MKNIMTAILLVASLLMLNVRAGICQESAATKEGGTKESSTQKQSQAAQQQGTNNSASAQPAKLDDKARKIKRVVEKVGISGRITLFLKNGEELYGNLVSYDEESVQITEVDLKKVVTVQYRNVKRVREGYGAPVPFTGKRRSPSKGEQIGIAAGLLFVVLALPLIILASAKD
ncbi:MAG: hypothetical protein LC731_07495 [Acidobacteria bacterium]|nr:hypothetical protein [Acidobacteriota bacterium]